MILLDKNFTHAYLVFIYYLLPCTLIAQEVPLDFYELIELNHSIDSGENWKSNTNLGSRRFFDISEFDNLANLDPESLYVDYRFGGEKLNGRNILYSFAAF